MWWGEQLGNGQCGDSGDIRLCQSVRITISTPCGIAKGLCNLFVSGQTRSIIRTISASFILYLSKNEISLKIHSYYIVELYLFQSPCRSSAEINHLFPTRITQQPGDILISGELCT